MIQKSAKYLCKLIKFFYFKPFKGLIIKQNEDLTCSKSVSID